MGTDGDGPSQVVEALIDMGCQAALVFDGSADGNLDEMLANGWKFDDEVRYVAGKRIRKLVRE